jgi:hypothetical protein
MSIAIWIIAALLAIHVVNGLSNSYDESRRWSRLEKRHAEKQAQDRERHLAWLFDRDCNYNSPRDFFAAAAMQGLLPKLPLVDQQGEHGDPVADKIAHNRDIAESCYWLADAMLEARAKP